MTDRAGSLNRRSLVILAGLLSLAFFAPGPIPAPWLDADIGAPGQVGGATYDPTNANWVVTGGGGDIWNAGDQGNFAYMPVSGDCVITANLTALTDSVGGTGMDQWSKAGVMIRDGTAAGAMHAFECGTGNNGTAFQYRLTTGAASGANGQTGAGALHRWLRMTRTGNAFQGAYSDDGVTWTNQGAAQTIAMPAAALVGLAVTAHNNATLSIATFNNLTVTNGTGGVLWPLPPPVVVSPPTAGFNSITLNWAAVPNAVTYSIFRAGAPGGPYPVTPLATVNAPTTTYTDTSAVYPTPYWYVVTANAPTIGTSAYSNEVTQTPLQPPISVDATTINTLEGGAPVIFNVTINQPLTGTNTIQFTISTNNGTEGQVWSQGQPVVVTPPATAASAQLITFTITGPQAAGLSFPVKVYGMDDPFVDGDQPFTVTVAFTSSQPSPFSGFTIPVINCTNVDNDVPGVVVSQTAGLITTEGGGTATFNVRLATSPSAALQLNIASSNTAEGTVSTGAFVFDSTNYVAGVDITVTGVDDTLLDFTVPYTINLSFSAGGAAEYGSVVPPSVSVSNLDNEVPPVLPTVWGSGCGLLGVEGLIALGGLAFLRRRTRA